jgi:predicted nucleic acid-binding protein
VIVLDASVLIAHFRRSDAHHEAATALLQAAGDQPLGASTVTLAEFLVGPTKTGMLDDAMRGLERLGIRELPLSDGAAVALAELRAQTGLKLPDCCVLHAARSADGSVATFDEQLAAAAATLGLRRPVPST